MQKILKMYIFLIKYLNSNKIIVCKVEPRSLKTAYF